MRLGLSSNLCNRYTRADLLSETRASGSVVDIRCKIPAPRFRRIWFRLKKGGRLFVASFPNPLPGRVIVKLSGDDDNQTFPAEHSLGTCLGDATVFARESLKVTNPSSLDLWWRNGVRNGSVRRRSTYRKGLRGSMEKRQRI
jgi:hypothetical protein